MACQPTKLSASTPTFEPEDIREALAYASALANEEVHLFTRPAA